MQMFDAKVQEFVNDIENVHMVWLLEIQQEANRMFSRWVDNLEVRCAYILYSSLLM